jgi:CxxC motif-containing protein (DUF1111 family)
MGITSPEFPDENCPSGDCDLLARCNPFPGLNDDGSGVTLFEDFMQFLAPPARGPIDATVTEGEAVFETIGCARCHTPTLVTGNSPVEALRFVAFHAYSDFLLHDMGSLGDGIETGGAGGNEFRTAPLWGVRMMSAFLHDGRASTLRDAIEAHDGQGKRARDAFSELSQAEQEALVTFLNSL